MPVEEPDEDEPVGPPPHPLDRVWFHPSEVGAALAAWREGQRPRRREWGLAALVALVSVGVVVGVLAGSSIGDPRALGLDALFPAFFVALLFEEVRGRRKAAAATGGAGIALVLTPIAPAGLPILVAAAAAFVAARLRP